MRDDKLMRIYQNGTYYYSCPYREPGAICCKMDVPCGKCGWNPEVEEKRKAALRASLVNREPVGWTLGSGSFSNVERLA